MAVRHHRGAQQGSQTGAEQATKTVTAVTTATVTHLGRHDMNAVAADAVVYGIKWRCGTPMAAACALWHQMRAPKGSIWLWWRAASTRQGTEKEVKCSL